MNNTTWTKCKSQCNPRLTYQDCKFIWEAKIHNVLYSNKCTATLFFFYNMQWYHNEVFRLPYGCTVSFSEGNKTWDKDIERRKKNRSLPASPNATVCLRNSVCSEHSDTIHIVLLSKDTVLRIIRLKNIQSFWELSGFKVLHTVSGLAEGKVMHLSLKLKSSSSLSTRPAISCCSL